MAAVALLVALLVALVYSWPWWAVAVLAVVLAGEILGELGSG